MGVCRCVCVCALCTCTWGGRLTHTGRIAVGVGNLLRQLLLGAAVRLVVFLLVLHQDLPHQLHRAGQWHASLQLDEREESSERGEVKLKKEDTGREEDLLKEGEMWAFSTLKFLNVAVRLKNCSIRKLWR